MATDASCGSANESIGCEPEAATMRASALAAAKNVPPSSLRRCCTRPPNRDTPAVTGSTRRPWSSVVPFSTRSTFVSYSAPASAVTVHGAAVATRGPAAAAASTSTATARRMTQRTPAGMC